MQLTERDDLFDIISETKNIRENFKSLNSKDKNQESLNLNIASISYLILILIKHIKKKQNEKQDHRAMD